MKRLSRSSLSPWLLVAFVVGGCGASSIPSPAATAAATLAPTPTAAVTASPAPSAPASPTAVDWNTALTVVPCPAPRSTAPACLDTNTNGDMPARTAAVKVGGDVTISMTVRNAAATASPPVTLVLFTFEPPFVPSFLKVTSCSAGCLIAPANAGLADLIEWPSLPPGDTVLTATLQVIARPGGIVGNDFEWLAGFVAKPASEAIDPASGIDSSTMLALMTGETTINP
jgi:hypothetical protein